MTLKDEIKALYPVVENILREVEQRGNDRVLDLTLKIKIIQVLQNIEEKL